MTEKQTEHILVVDDDARIRQMLMRYFEDEGFRLTAVDSGKQMWSALERDDVDIVLLDLILPGGEDGLTLARELRAKSDLPIIMLTGRDDVVDRIVGLEMGADDYIPKPFHLREVLARVRTVLRRRGGEPAAKTNHAAPADDHEVIRFDGWSLDLGRRQLRDRNDAEVELTTGEFDMLAVLATHPGRVLGREALMDMTRGRNLEAFDRSIDAQIARLRKKVEADPKHPVLIKSVRGVGYVFTGKSER